VNTVEFSLIFARKACTMKQNKSIFFILLVLVVIASVYRVIPGRPWGFTPQIAMALFGGALFVKDKKWAFALPLLSMFISDCLYQVLYVNGLTEIRGFYGGQWENYLLFAGMTCIGFLVKMNKVFSIAAGILAAPTAFFLVSNFIVWASHGGYVRPYTFEGLMQCYGDGWPFYKGELLGTTVFGVVLFGGYYLVKNFSARKQLA